MLSKPKRISHTYANQVIFGFLSLAKLLELQALKRRFYREFIPAVVEAIRVFTKKGFQLKRDSPYIEVFSQTRQNWERFFCMREADSRDHIRNFFKGRRP